MRRLRRMGIGIGIEIGGSDSVAPAPTATITSPAAGFLYDKEYDVNLAVSFTCTDATSATLYAIVDGAVAASWGVDADPSEGSGTITRALQAADVGAVVELYVTVVGPGGTADSATVTGEVTDVRGLVTTYDGFEIDVPTSTLTSVGVADPGFANGGFDADSDWTKGAGWSIADGVATHASGSTSILSQDVSQTIGYETEVTFTVTATAGGTGTQCMAGTTTGTLRTTTATFTEHKTQAGNTTVGLQTNTGTTASVDNCSCRSLSVSTCTVTKAGASFAGATWTQAVTTRIPYVASDKQINGRDAASFYTGDWFESSVAPANMKWLHYNAAGANYAQYTLVYVMRPALNVGFLQTYNPGVNAGVGWFINADGSMFLRTSESGGATLYDCTSAAGTIVSGTTYILSAKSDGTNLIMRKNGSQVATVACVGTPTDTNPTYSFRIGGYSTSAVGGEIAYVLALKDDCTAGQLAMVERFLSKRFGIALA